MIILGHPEVSSVLRTEREEAAKYGNISEDFPSRLAEIVRNLTSVKFEIGDPEVAAPAVSICAAIYKAYLCQIRLAKILLIGEKFPV